MDTKTESPSSTAAVMIAVIRVGGGENLRCGASDVEVEVMGRVEGFGVRKADGVVVEAPGVDEDRGIFGMSLPSTQLSESHVSLWSSKKKEHDGKSYLQRDSTGTLVGRQGAIASLP